MTFDRPENELWVEPATQTVLVQLRELILSGALETGTRLRAEALAARLGVSRTPIRSALAILAGEGLVEYQANRGYMVRQQTVELVIKAIEAYATLQSAAARAVAGRPDRVSTIRQLGMIHDELGAIIRDNSWSLDQEKSWFESNYAFHRTLLHAAENPFLRSAIRMTIVYPVFSDILRFGPVAERVHPELREIPKTVPDYAISAQFDQGRLLVRLGDGDGERAAALMYEHAVSNRDRILRALATTD